jgi:hypothetical protein
MKSALGLACCALPDLPATAQTVQSEQTTQSVAAVTEAFFTQIQNEDFRTEMGFLSTRLAASLGQDGWANLRTHVIEKTGPTPAFTPHRLTYYQQDTLLAAVDYSGQTKTPDTYICGFLLWELPTENTASLLRFEQNIVEKTVFNAMDAETAIQLMTQWQCPPNLIAHVLDGVSTE